MTSNNNARKRGGTFHQDSVHQQELSLHFDDEPEQVNINKLSLDNNNNANNDFDEAFEETISRGRSRSRSVHENDDLIPYVLNQPALHSISNQNDNPNSFHNKVDDNSIDIATDKEIKRRYDNILI